MSFEIMQGDALDCLQVLADSSVDCCVTSPPYWGLRDYGHEGQLGLEPTPEAYVAGMVAVFHEVLRVLKPTGTCWLNIGDSYATGTTAPRKQGTRGIGNATQSAQDAVPRCGTPEGVKTKDLVEPCILAGTSEYGCCSSCGKPWERIVEKGAPDAEHQRLCGADSTGGYSGQSTKDYKSAKAQDASATKARILAGMVHRKTVGWRPTCVCGAAPRPSVVLDPFTGSGTVGVVALKNGRSFIGCELNPDYIAIAEKRAEPLILQELLA